MSCDKYAVAVLLLLGMENEFKRNMRDGINIYARACVYIIFTPKEN